MRKYPQIEGILYEIKISQVTRKYLDSKFADKNETLEGHYDPATNIIHISKELPNQSKIHILFHELYHMFIEHTERMDEEAKADAFAAWILRIFKPESIEELLK